MTPPAAPATALSTQPSRPAIPAVGPLRAVKVPAVSERHLANGLRVCVVRRAGVPRFEARLVVPVARDGDAGETARLEVLAKTLLSGTADRDSVTIAEDLQRLGASLDADVNAEELAVRGSALASNLRPFLALLADVVFHAAYPADEVTIERERLAEEITLARSDPATIAREALLRRLHGRHPYGRGMPAPPAVRRVRPASLRSAHAERVRPEGSLLVIVGDLRPQAALDAAEEALGDWATGGGAPGVPPPPAVRPGPVILVDRPGAVQTNLRIGGPAVGRAAAEFPALALANLVFGGSFSSRLVDNIRERRGYTYSPGSAVQHARAGSTFFVRADVATDVTAPALVEIRYELARMATLDVEEAELVAAKRYLTGTLAMSVQTQSGLASYLATLLASGLDLGYLRDLPRRVEATGTAAVREAAARFFSPRRLVTVMVGDASMVRSSLEALDDVEVVPA